MKVGEPGHPILDHRRAGAGKTWLVHQLARLLPSSWLLAHVDLDQGDDGSRLPAIDWSRTGTSPFSRSRDRTSPAAARFCTTTRSMEGDWMLVVDDAHRGSPVVWDEIRAIVNQSGQARRLWGNRCSGRHRARPINGHAGIPADSHPLYVFIFTCRRSMLTKHASCLKFTGRTRSRPIGSSKSFIAMPGAMRAVCFVLHSRDGGACRSLWPFAQRITPRPSGRERLVSRMTRSTVEDEPEKLESPQPVPAPPIAAPRVESFRSDAPSLVPAKPPIRIEEGLVEVGWDGDLETDFLESSETASDTGPRPAHESSFNEELIEDPYAALQAWSEWTGGQEPASSRSVTVENPPVKTSAEPVPAGSCTGNRGIGQPPRGVTGDRAPGGQGRASA